MVFTSSVARVALSFAIVASASLALAPDRALADSIALNPVWYSSFNLLASGTNYGNRWRIVNHTNIITTDRSNGSYEQGDVWSTMYLSSRWVSEAQGSRSNPCYSNLIATFPAGIGGSNHRIYVEQPQYCYGFIDQSSGNTNFFSIMNWIGEYKTYRVHYKGTAWTEDNYVVVTPDSSGWIPVNRVIDAFVICYYRDTSFNSSIGSEFSGAASNHLMIGWLSLPSIIYNFPDGALSGIVSTQTNSILSGQQLQTDTLMDTSGSGSILSGALGGSDADDFSDAMGVSDAINISTGGFGAMLGVEPDGVIRFNGLSLGEQFGYFAIPAFSVDVWQYIPSGVATTIKTGFTGVCVFSWSAGMKKFFDRIFHGEQVVTVD